MKPTEATNVTQTNTGKRRSTRTSRRRRIPIGAYTDYKPFHSKLHGQEVLGIRPINKSRSMQTSKVTILYSPNGNLKLAFFDDNQAASSKKILASIELNRSTGEILSHSGEGDQELITELAVKYALDAFYFYHGYQIGKQGKSALEPEKLKFAQEEFYFKQGVKTVDDYKGPQKKLKLSNGMMLTEFCPKRFDGKIAEPIVYRITSPDGKELAEGYPVPNEQGGNDILSDGELDITRKQTLEIKLNNDSEEAIDGKYRGTIKKTVLEDGNILSAFTAKEPVNSIVGQTIYTLTNPDGAVVAEARLSPPSQDLIFDSAKWSINKKTLKKFINEFNGAERRKAIQTAFALGKQTAIAEAKDAPYFLLD